MKFTKEINEYGDTIYTNNIGQYSRQDGPAIEYANGNKLWYMNGKLHRQDGPAVDYKYGYEDNYKCMPIKQYWLNGKRYDNICNISSDEEWINLVQKILLLG